MRAAPCFSAQTSQACLAPSAAQTATSHHVSTASTACITCLGRQIHRPQIILVLVLFVQLHPGHTQKVVETVPAVTVASMPCMHAMAHVPLAHIRQILDRLAWELQPKCLDGVPHVRVLLLRSAISQRPRYCQSSGWQTRFGSSMRAFGATLFT